MGIHSNLRLLTAGTHLLSNSTDFIKSVKGFQPFNYWLQKNPSRDGTVLKIVTMVSKKKSFRTRDSWEVFSEMSSSSLLFMKVMF